MSAIRIYFSSPFGVLTGQDIIGPMEWIYFISPIGFSYFFDLPLFRHRKTSSMMIISAVWLNKYDFKCGAWK